MTENIDKNEQKQRTARINKIVTYSSIAFVIGLVIHLYFAVGNWSFITSFFGSNPIPYIMLGFVSILVYFFYATYIYFRKHL